MAAPTDTFIDPADGAAAGNDHGGAAFVDGTFANATNTLTKIGAFPAVTCQAGDKIYVDDNGSGQVAAGLYTINVRTDNDNVVLNADIRSGAPDPVDCRVDQHTGVVGLPWATVQHALDFTTRDAANGDRFNIKAGTADVLAASLDFTTYGAPGFGAPVIFSGYTAAAGDGGIGTLDGAGNFAIYSAGADAVHFVDMKFQNWSAATYAVTVGNHGLFFRVEADGSVSGLHGISVSNSTGRVISCYVHDVGSGVLIDANGLVLDCFFEGCTTYAILMNDNNAKAFNNTIKVTTVGAWGIYCNDSQQVIIGNSIYNSAAGTNAGIDMTLQQDCIVINNIIEGWSGVGGVGLEGTADVMVEGYNAFYNNTTSKSIGAVHVDLGGDIDPLAASAFNNAGADDFTVKVSVKALGYPTANYPGLAVRSYLDMGALQREEAGGGAGGLIIHPGMTGGCNG